MCAQGLERLATFFIFINVIVKIVQNRFWCEGCKYSMSFTFMYSYYINTGYFFFFWLEDLSLFLLKESWGGGGATELLSLYFGSLSDPPCSEVFIPNSVVIFCFLPHKPVISTHGHSVTSSLEFFFIKKLHLFFFVFFTISFFFFFIKVCYVQ